MPAALENDEISLTGLAVCPGVALGRVCLMNEERHADLDLSCVSIEAVDQELQELERARRVAVVQLEDLARETVRRIGESEAAIFMAQRMIVEDVALNAEVTRYIEASRMTAAAALSLGLDGLEKRLAAVDDEYISERATDIGEVKRRLLDALARVSRSLRCDGQSHCQRGQKRIVVAGQLTAGLVLEVAGRGVKGLVTERGGAGCHGAILAKSLGIPTVTGIDGAVQRAACGAEVLVDGSRGEVVLWPSRQRVDAVRSTHSRPVVSGRSEPVDDLEVMANINGSHDVHDATRSGAEGIGLYRTEVEVFAAQQFLAEEEQTERYQQVIRAMDGRPVYFRMLDLGGDKRLSESREEDNPQLGLRGTRLLLARPDILGPQARALARASVLTGQPVHVMYPMVTGVDQFLRVRAAFTHATENLAQASIRHGIMLEVPAACLQAHELFQRADFASIGTNDLVQFLYAVDRDNNAVAADYSPDGPALWWLLRQVASAARATGRPLSICGEIAGDPDYLKKIVGSGIHSVSVTPTSIASIRARARQLGPSGGLAVPDGIGSADQCGRLPKQPSSTTGVPASDTRSATVANRPTAVGAPVATGRARP
ncbi:MAG: phosphoenolpyruvate--protein phosphotransferase [Deltaproteobacteria bacterium RIFOXYA12_FULL_58_15]|nr:MAG: phosphoenolpyruvate--protein phosphotransferase [Deltaproteobacteria bacterium RIFOXYA12_FULL_58_15]